MTQFWGPFTQAPNILILITDQQRTAQHYPKGWTEAHLPNLHRLCQTGVSFPNAMTNATSCSPSRAVLWASTYPAVNGVLHNMIDLSAQLGSQVKPCPNSPARKLATLGQILSEPGLAGAPAGLAYNVAYKGKWHLQASYTQGITAAQQRAPGYATAQGADNTSMVDVYGFSGWNSPDFGTCMDLNSSFTPECANTLGGGAGGNDARVANGISYAMQGGQPYTVDSAGDYLRKRFAQGPTAQPFCLVVSLVGPHDVFVSPNNYISAGYLSEGESPPWQMPPFTAIQACPPSYRLSPAQLANKPSAQQNSRSGLGPEQALDYLRFYAYLEVEADKRLGEVLAALPSDEFAHTLIVRIADHGEMGMSQGGMWEKTNQAYNETLLVPMVFSHPGLPQGQVCTALAGLIDIVPTLAEICGLPALASHYAIQGRSLAPAILAGAAGRTRHELLFCSDEGAIVRALVDDRAPASKYVVTANGSGWQFELYDFKYAPDTAQPRAPETDNLIPVSGQVNPAAPLPAPTLARWQRLHAELTHALADTLTTPAGWPSTLPA